MTLEHRLAALVPRLREALDRRPTTPVAEDLMAVLVEDYPTMGPAHGRVERLTDDLGLTPLDAELLVIAAAVDLDVRFGAVFGQLLGADRWWPTIGLALELVGAGTLAGAERGRFGPTEPLRRHGLVSIDDAGPFLLRSLRAEPRVVDHLVGSPTPDPELGALVVTVPSRTDEVAHRIAGSFGAGARLAHVRSRASAAGAATAHGAMELFGVPALVIDLSRADIAAPDVARRTRDAVREAGLRSSGLVLTGVDRLLPQDRSLLVELEGAPVPVAVVDDLSWEGDWFRGPMVTLDATPLGVDERADLWRAALGAESAEAVGGLEWLNLVGLRITPENLAAAIDTARIAADTDGERLAIGHLHDAARDQGRLRLESAGVRTAPRVRLGDLVVSPMTRHALEEVVSWARHREALFGAGRLTGRGTKGHGLTAMFAGSAGTGKTLAAEAVAGELGLELCTVDLSLVVDKYIGETEKHLEEVISEAENLNVVLFFDEADSLFGSRSAVTDSRDRYANQEVAYLLQRIERFEGLAILATNLRGNLDPAFTRRLHHIITFTDPDAETRRGLWDSHLREVVALDAADPLDLAWLAESVELAGGDIRNIVMTAAFAAAGETDSGVAAPGPRAIGMRHVLYAVEREYRKQAKRMPPPPGSAALSPTTSR